MNNTITQALNEQLRREFQAAFLYLAFSANLKEYGLGGAAHWMRMQYHEECNHALKILHFLEECDARVRIPAIEIPDYSWSSPQDLFELALVHEQRVTAAIHTLLALSRQEKDAATELFLFYFVNEQVEEENTLRGILRQLQLGKGHNAALLQIDAQLAARSTVPPQA